jgi:hypothetical protein
MKVWEPLFFAVNPPSRSNNHFCKPIDWSAIRMKQAARKEDIQHAWSPGGYGTDGDRYHGMNLGVWWRQGSIEFRYFSGTFAFEKAAAAIMLSVLFIEASASKTRINIPDNILSMTYDQIWQMAGNVGLENYVEKFFRDHLAIRSGECPAFAALKKFVKERVATFWENDGTQRGGR